MNSLRFSRSRWGATLAGALSIVASSLGMVTASAAGAADLRSGGNLVVVASGLSQMGSGQLRGVCVDPSGNLFFVNTLQPFIFELTVSSNYTQVITVAGTGASANLVAGAATSSPINRPRALICRPSGNILFTTVNQVGKLTRNGSSYNVSVIAGSGGSGKLVDGGDALTEPLSAPGGLTVGNNGVIYTVDSTSNVVYSFTPSGSGYVMNIIAGTGSAGTPSAGPSLQSRLLSPTDIAFTPSGTLLVSDTNNGFVEQLTSTSQGWYTRIVGQFSAPRGLAVDANGNVYVADSTANRIYEMTPYGNSYDITVVAGSGVAGFPVAGPATSSPLNNPRFIALDSYGDLVIGDSGNGVVEAVLPNNVVAPTAPTVIAESITSSGAITFDWSVSNNGGADITSYSWSGACSGSGNTTTVTCTGLSNHQDYTLWVTATNALGDSSPGSSTATGETVPDAPQAVNLSAGVGSISVDGIATSNDGGSPVTSYTVIASDPAGNTQACTVAFDSSQSTQNCVLQGLTNGTTYQIAVFATNTLGNSSSLDAGSVSTPDVPAAPVVTTAPVSSSGEITYNWVDLNTGGSDITSYTWSGACSGSGNTTTVTCTGLTGGTSYELNVTATNGVGTSDSGSAQVTTPSVPSAPRYVTTTVTLHSVTVTWSPALTNGGSPVTAYVATALDANNHEHVCTANSSATTCTIANLDSGVTYGVSVVALGEWGNSPSANGGSSTTWHLPAAPAVGSALSRSRAAVLNWSAPSDNGGSAVSSYTVTDGHGHQCITALTSCTISGLTNGTSYVFTVTASSLAGTSPVATFASVMPLGANITQRVAGFDINSASVTADMATQIRALASAIVASGRHSVSITGYGNVGLPNAVRLARATHARSILLAALVAAGHRDVVISVAVGPASTTFGTGGPAVLAASTRCVVIATH